jgi:hypothetical protein
MNIDQSLLFAHDENEIILEVDEEDALFSRPWVRGWRSEGGGCEGGRARGSPSAVFDFVR